jgi:hypothetical protein
MLDTEYNEAEVKELFMEEGRAEERVNTEREKKRADEAEHERDVEKKRADEMAGQLEEARREIERLKAASN